MRLFIFFFVFALGLSGCSFLGVNAPPRTPAGDDSSAYGEIPVIPAEQNLTFEKFRDLVLSPGPSSIEKTLQKVRELYPEYMAFNTLMYGSRSLQESSFTNPRVLVFGPASRFVFSFNGNERQAGGSSFETMEYSPEKNRFLFREIAFKTKSFRREDSELNDDEIEFEDSRMIVSKSDPVKCMICHGFVSSHPVWDSYFVWAGAYGSEFNLLYLNFDSQTRSGLDWTGIETPISQGMHARLREGVRDAEVEGMKKYLDGKYEAHSRYKWLPPQISEKGFAGVASGRKLSELDLAGEYSKERARVMGPREWPSRPNQFFQNSLHHLVNLKLIGDLKKAGVAPNAFRSSRDGWNSLNRAEESTSVGELAKRISKFTEEFQFRRKRPSVAEIEKQLRENIRTEIEMQRKKFRHQEAVYGPGSLQSQSGSESGRFAMEWMGNVFEFYREFLGLKNLTEVDRLAMTADTDNMVLVTALQILLKDVGINLNDYSMTLDPTACFYLDGLVEAAEYLGIEVSPDSL